MPTTIHITDQGDQTISGVKTFDVFPIVSGNKLITGVDLSPYATITNLANTGSTLDSKIGSLSGNLTSTYATITNLASTGSTLATNLASTGSTLDAKINTLSGSSVLLYGNQSIGGIKTFRDNVYINNLFVTGTETIVSTNNFSVQSPYVILNLTGGAVDGGIFFITGSGLTGINDTGPIIGFDHSTKFKFGFGTRNSDLSTLPDIASVQNIEALSGVADNKFSTITNLASTGSTLQSNINTVQSNLSTTGIALQTNLSLSQTNLQTNIDTVANNLASTGTTLSNNITTLTNNLASTGTTLNSKIDLFSGTYQGFVDNLDATYATDASVNAVANNLASTGSTLQTNINNLSNTYATISNVALTGSTLATNIASTGSTLQTNINNLSNTYATISNVALTGSTLATNLASTGSTLNTKIDNLSGYINSPSSNIVFTTGDQTISGIKTFAQTGSFDTVQITNKKLSSYNYVNSNFIFGDIYINIANSSNNIIGTLPSGITSGINYYVKNLNSGILLITGSGQRTIDGFSTVNLYRNESLQLIGVNNVGYTGWVTLSADNGVS